MVKMDAPDSKVNANVSSLSKKLLEVRADAGAVRWLRLVRW
jgi:hypothetical protein